MGKSRSKKASLNVVVMGAYEVVAFICGLILPRLILQYFGSTYNGIISSAVQFLAFISILRMGIAGATRVALYGPLANNDLTKISGIVNATERYMRRVGIFLLIYIAILAAVYPFVAETDLEHWVSALLIVIIGAGTFAQYFFGITYQTLLAADQSSYIYFGISIGQTIANTIIASALILTGFNIFIVRLGSAIVFVTTPILLRLYVRRKYKLDDSAPCDDSGLKGRWNVMWHSIANIVHANAGIVILTLFVDIKIVSVYTVYYLIINGLQKIMQIFTTGLEGAFGNMFARGEHSIANRNLDIFEFLMFSFVSVVFSCAIVLIVPFVGLYTKGVHDVNYIVHTFAYLAVIAMGVQCIRQPYLTVVQAAGHYKETRYGAAFEAIINITLSLSLTYKYGLMGVTIGVFAANLFRTSQYIYHLRHNILHRKLSKALTTFAWLTMNFVIIICVCFKLLELYAISEWTHWIIAGFLCFFISLAITVLSALLFQRNKFMMATEVVRRMLPARK